MNDEKESLLQLEPQHFQLIISLFLLLLCLFLFCFYCFGFLFLAGQAIIFGILISFCRKYCPNVIICMQHSMQEVSCLLSDVFVYVPPTKMFALLHHWKSLSHMKLKHNMTIDYFLLQDSTALQVKQCPIPMTTYAPKDITVWLQHQLPFDANLASIKMSLASHHAKLVQKVQVFFQ